MVGRRWPAAGMSHVASNIHVAGRRNAFSQRSLSNVQIARLALLEVNEKMPGRYAATKAVRHGGAQPWAAPPCPTNCLSRLRLISAGRFQSLGHFYALSVLETFQIKIFYNGQ